MSCRHVVAAIAAIGVFGGRALALPCTAASYPAGAVSFADTVIQYHPLFQGGPGPTDPKYTSPAQALGPPNYVPDAGGVGGAFNGTGSVALGRGGLLALRFTDNVVVNGAGADLGICEVGFAERYFVALRPASSGLRTQLQLAGLCVNLRAPNDTFCDLVGAMNGPVILDLDDVFPGFAAGELRFDAVQLIDGMDFNSGSQVGADIDAVGAVHLGGYACGDGRVEGAETCDDGNTAAGDGCDETCRIETCWTCSGEPSSCAVADGAACEDGEPCTAGDQCQGAVCIGGPPPSCDDGNVCTDDACTPGVGCTFTPNVAPCSDDSSCSTGDTCSDGACRGNAVEASGCALAGGKLRIVNRDDDAGDSLVWIWGKGSAEFATGAPLIDGGRYELCVFDGPAHMRRLRVAAHAGKGGFCNGQPCWKPKGTVGYRFKHFAAPTGVRQLTLKGGAGNAKIVAKGRGAALDVSGDLDLGGSVRVQLRDPDSGACWAATFTEPIVSDARRYKAKQ